MIPRQVEESKKAGADAILVLREYLTINQYIQLIQACQTYGLVPVVEINSNPEEKGWDFRGPVLVNSRDLNTGKINKKQAVEICKTLKKAGKNVIYGSGEKSDVMIKNGVADAVLIGTAFMRGEVK